LGPHWGTWWGAPSTRYFERQLEKDSGNRASVSMETLWGEPKGRAPLLGTLKATSDNSRKALKMERLSPYRSSMMGTWREGSYTENSRKHLIEGSENGAFLLNWGERILSN